MKNSDCVTQPLRDFQVLALHSYLLSEIVEAVYHVMKNEDFS